MSSGCNAGVSPQGRAVELAAMKVRFVHLTEELIWCFGKPEMWTRASCMWASHGEAENVVS